MNLDKLLKIRNSIKHLLTMKDSFARDLQLTNKKDIPIEDIQDNLDHLDLKLTDLYKKVQEAINDVKVEENPEKRSKQEIESLAYSFKEALDSMCNTFKPHNKDLRKQLNKQNKIFNEDLNSRTVLFTNCKIPKNTKFKTPHLPENMPQILSDWVDDYNKTKNKKSLWTKIKIKKGDNKDDGQD